jgi:hypothetical protein
LYAKQYFKDLLWVNANKENFAAGMFTALTPSECTPELAGRLNQYVNSQKILQPVVVKNLKIYGQEGERCRKIVTLAESVIRASAPTATP